jgi:translocation and assembly module TamA
MLAIVLAAGGCAREAAHGRSWVHRVRFVGLERKEAAALAERIAVEETSWAPWARKKWLDQFALEGDRERIEAWLRARGYYDGKVTAARSKPWKRGGVDVEFIIERGLGVRIRQLSVSGADPKSFSLRTGELFDHDRYLLAKRALYDTLRERGHAWARVDGDVQVDADQLTAVVHVTVAPGPRAVLGDIEVEGAVHVDPRLIARHSGLARGDPFRPERLEEARGRVFALGFFSSVSVDIDPRPSEVAHVRLVVHEAPLDEIRLGGGLGIEAQRVDAHARVAWVRHALGGGLRRLKLSATPAYVLLLSPTWSDVLNHGPAASTELELRQLDKPWRLSTISWLLAYDLGIEYAYQYHGPRTQLAFSQALWRDRVHVGISYDFQFLDFFNTAPAIFDNPTLSGAMYGYQDPYRVAWLQQEVSLDLRDRPLDAHKGGYLSFGAEEGGIYTGSAFTYEKILAQASGYVPFGARGTVAARMQFGQMWNHDPQGSPITRRFYLGGPSSHRGFSYNRLSPQVVDTLTGVRVPVGGEQMFLAQLELRVEVLKIAGSWLGLVGFTDAGDVVATGNVDLASLHWAVGGGLRYKTLLGTLRLDFAGRVTRLGPGDPDPGCPFAFHLSLGESF